MMNSMLALPIVMALAELVGAALYVASPQGPIRNIVACFGLGFALCIVLIDVTPDATEDYLAGWAFLAAGAAIGAVLMFKGGRLGVGAGNTGAIVGMGLHNICEGIVLAAAGPAISPLIFTAAVAHKLPEGMVVFSLADGLPLARRWLLAIALCLLIPIGTVIDFPEEIKKPLLAFAAGVLALALIKALTVMFGLGEPARAAAGRRAIAASAAGGAVVAGLTCLVI
jgi:zinc transporter ZupT